VSCLNSQKREVTAGYEDGWLYQWDEGGTLLRGVAVPSSYAPLSKILFHGDDIAVVSNHGDCAVLRFNEQKDSLEVNFEISTKHTKFHKKHNRLAKPTQCQIIILYLK
jgi:hypothetical protein